MKNSEECVMHLARRFSEIHSHSLAPFYIQDESSFWDGLIEYSNDDAMVDKAFFIAIAKKVLMELENMQ